MGGKPEIEGGMHSVLYETSAACAGPAASMIPAPPSISANPAALILRCRGSRVSLRRGTSRTVGWFSDRCGVRGEPRQRRGRRGRPVPPGGRPLPLARPGRNSGSLTVSPGSSASRGAGPPAGTAALARPTRSTTAMPIRNTAAGTTRQSSSQKNVTPHGRSTPRAARRAPCLRTSPRPGSRRGRPPTVRRRA